MLLSLSVKVTSLYGMKILVSNPSKQYTPFLIRALLDKGFTVCYATSYWYKKNHFVLRFLANHIKSLSLELRKREDKLIPDNIVVTHFVGVVYKFIGRFFIRDTERLSFYEDRIHDWWVKKYLVEFKPNIIIGYEKSCHDSFVVANKLGICTILDLAQVHTAFIKQLRNETSFFSEITGSNVLFERIHSVKQSEYALSSRIICLSSFAARTILTHNGIKANLHVANLGFDPKRFHPKSSYLRSDNLELIYVGIVTKRKGIHNLIELMNSLRIQPIHLTVVGPWGDASDILNSHSKYPNISYIPYLYHEALAERLRQSDVFILPSYLDSWAAVVLEAMACGLPVITTTQTGASEVVGNDAGVVLEAGDVNGLRNAVMGYLNNASLIEQHGRSAVRKVQAYHWGRYFEQVQRVVEHAFVN